MHEYKIKDFKILHYDLYRIRNTNELENIGILENKEKSIIFVEWPELIKKEGSNNIFLNFKYEENLKKRSLTIIPYNNQDSINAL